MSFAHRHLQIQVSKFCFNLNTCYSILENLIYLFCEIHNQIHHLMIEQALKFDFRNYRSSTYFSQE